MTTPLQPGQSVTVPGIGYGLTISGTTVTSGATPDTVITAAPMPPPQPDPRVMSLQIDLNLRGANLLVDGFYGPLTDAANRALWPSLIATMWGSSTPPPGDPVKVEAATKVLEGKVGTTLGAHRTYFTDLNATTGYGSPAGLAAVVANDQLAGRASYLSIKNNNSHTGWAEVAAMSPAVKAGCDVIVRAVLNTVEPIYLSFHHEPENDFGTGRKGTVTQADRDGYRFAADAFYAYLRPKVPGNVYIGSTYMQYTLTTAGAADWGHTSLWLPDKARDFVGFDDYFKGLANVLAFADSKGIDLIGIGEFGKSLADAGSEAAQTAYLQWYIDFAAAHPDRFLTLCWWNVVAMQPSTLALLGQTIQAGRIVAG